MTSIDVTLNILETLLKEKPDSVFIGSLYQQYCNRGGLSKKQLEGLHAKAKQSALISTAKLATLEAIIKKKPNRYKSELIIKISEAPKDDVIENAVQQILIKYPNHKMALFIQSKLEHKEPLSKIESDEVKRLAKLLCK